MRFSVLRIPGGARARLREELNIASVTEDRDHLVQLLQPAAVLELDLGGLTEIDTAGVQLLVALRKEADSLDCSCRFVGSGDTVQEAFGCLGLGHLLEEPLVGKSVRHGS